MRILPTSIHSGPTKPLGEPIRRARREFIPVDVLEYVNIALHAAERHPNQPVLRYAYMLLHDVLDDFSTEGWSLLQSALLNSMPDEPAFPAVLELLLLARHAGRPIALSGVERTVISFLERHAPAGRANEVAWGLWALLAFNIGLGTWVNMSEELRSIASMTDDIVALLALDLNQRGLAGFSTSVWEQEMIEDNLLEGQHWLLAYEALSKNWLGSLNGQNYVSTNQFFADIHSKGVSFYDEQATAQPMATIPPIARPFPGGSIGTFYT